MVLDVWRCRYLGYIFDVLRVLLQLQEGAKPAIATTLKLCLLPLGALFSFPGLRAPTTSTVEESDGIWTSCRGQLSCDAFLFSPTTCVRIDSGPLVPVVWPQQTRRARCRSFLARL